MVGISKFKTIDASCEEYVHPWTPSCSDASAELFIQAFQKCLKIYTTAYMATLLMRGEMPTQSDILRTLHGIIQSTAFLTTNGFTYSIFLCSLRRLLGNFNFLTVSFVPSFLSSLVAISIERPSRRNLLCLYVSNEATETLWNMALSRGLVKSWKHGSVAIFSFSIAILLYHYRANNHLKNDTLQSISRFVIGSHEEYGFILPKSSTKATENKIDYLRTNSTFYMFHNALLTYTNVINKLKNFGKTKCCFHRNSCVFYAMQNCLKMFSLGAGFQIVLKLFMQFSKLRQKPRLIPETILNKSSVALGIFLGGFTGIYSITSCMLRLLRGHDDPLHALPAGILAGMAFAQYPDSSIALYVMWKMLQISYNAGVSNGFVPAVPGFAVLLYCFSTALLFHAATLEPTNLRPSYWKFLHGLSGGRIAGMARDSLDIWGLQTSKSLQDVLLRTNTKLEVSKFL